MSLSDQPKSPFTEVPESENLLVDLQHTSALIRFLEAQEGIPFPSSAFPKLSTPVIATLGFACCRPLEEMVTEAQSWVNSGVQFEVIMIGALAEWGIPVSLLDGMPLNKLCSDNGYLVLWTEFNQMSTLYHACDNLLPSFKFFDEMVFFEPQSFGMRAKQWHCMVLSKGENARLLYCSWMRLVERGRSVASARGPVPESLYELVEHLSPAARKLHVIPPVSSVTEKRNGWVVLLSSICEDNFLPASYSRS